MIGVQTIDTASPMLDKLKPAVSSVLRDGVFAAAQFAAGEIRRTVMSKLKGRTGNLARSYKETFLRSQPGMVSAGAVSDLSYARIQDEGGTIRPKSVKHLAVPIMSGKRLPVGKWPRHFAKGELVYIARKDKDPLLARPVGKGEIEPLFVLKKSVKLKAKHYIAEARRRSGPRINEIVGRKVSIAVRKVAGGV